MAAAAATEDEPYYQGDVDEPEIPPNFPTHKEARRSAKLAALHARLSLPARLPLQTLARCLIDPSVDPRPGYNNAPFAILGQELLGYHTTEYLICKYPRLPMPVLYAAQYAYVGPATLGAMRLEWGVEAVAAPGPEVDAGLLQLKRMPAGNAMAPDGQRRLKDVPSASKRKSLAWDFARGMSSRIVYADQFGDFTAEVAPYPGAPISRSASTSSEAENGEDPKEVAADAAIDEPFTLTSPPVRSMHTEPTTVEAASAGFVRALAGAVYLHAGSQAAKDFHKAHVMSRTLQLHTMFNFTHPTRDLSRLCAREGFEPPVARLISETGRLSRSPVFIVGVFSGNDKLGEGAGSSLNEGRVRAASAALRAWYLYSPPDNEIVYPSEVEGSSGSTKKWKPQMIDIGEVIT
ncbi:54S ribosomal L3, mitochondrial [Lecanosticta acicola]|uniref:Large ribosomal subunit protein mL44 n=1 Tax=Lecanosticta acicola TaxID=111012 RepID=A0AAI8Z770_9PEZI|nr:54S ribosomal L3, mitochondrial [Lecanosticta acicola]